MSATICGSTIELTRGDTLQIVLEIKDISGETYTPTQGDTLRFKMKRNYTSPDTLIEKTIDIYSMGFIIQPEDTSGLSFGNYVYDIQLTTAAGVVDTVIPRGIFKILAEVDE